jgi:hypothetical protein
MAPDSAVGNGIFIIVRSPRMQLDPTFWDGALRTKGLIFSSAIDRCSLAKMHRNTGSFTDANNTHTGMYKEPSDYFTECLLSTYPLHWWTD